MPAAAGRAHSRTASKAACILCKSPAKHGISPAKMLGQTLVTHQTGPEGRVVNKVLVAEVGGHCARDLLCHSARSRDSSAA